MGGCSSKPAARPQLVVTTDVRSPRVSISSAGRRATPIMTKLPGDTSLRKIREDEPLEKTGSDTSHEGRRRREQARQRKRESNQISARHPFNAVGSSRNSRESTGVGYRQGLDSSGNPNLVRTYDRERESRSRALLGDVAERMSSLRKSRSTPCLETQTERSGSAKSEYSPPLGGPGTGSSTGGTGNAAGNGIGNAAGNTGTSTGNTTWRQKSDSLSVVSTPRGPMGYPVGTREFRGTREKSRREQHLAIHKLLNGGVGKGETSDSVVGEEGKVGAKEAKEREGKDGLESETDCERGSKTHRKSEGKSVASVQERNISQRKVSLSTASGTGVHREDLRDTRDRDSRRSLRDSMSTRATSGVNSSQELCKDGRIVYRTYTLRIRQAHTPLY